MGFKKQTAGITFEKCSVYSTFTQPEHSLEIEISFKSEFWSKWEHNYIRGTTRTNTSTRRNSSLEAFELILLNDVATMTSSVRRNLQNLQQHQSHRHAHTHHSLCGCVQTGRSHFYCAR